MGIHSSAYGSQVKVYAGDDVYYKQLAGTVHNGRSSQSSNVLHFGLGDNTSVDQISDELIKHKREQLNLRFQKSSGQLDNTSRVKEVRRTIAKLKTIQNEKNKLQEKK